MADHDADDTPKTHKTVKVFHAGLQRETDHVISTNKDTNELVLTCTETGHSLKFDGTLSADEIKSLLATHKEVNTGQVPVDAAAQSEKAAALESTAVALADGETTTPHATQPTNTFEAAPSAGNAITVDQTSTSTDDVNQQLHDNLNSANGLPPQSEIPTSTATDTPAAAPEAAPTDPTQEPTVS